MLFGQTQLITARVKSLKHKQTLSVSSQGTNMPFARLSS